jgi:hypothetical protein
MPRKKKTQEIARYNATYYVARRGIITESEDGGYDLVNDQMIPLYCETKEQAIFAKQVYYALLMTSHTVILDPPEIENVHLPGFMPIDGTISVIKHILKDENYFTEVMWVEEFSFNEL